MMKSLLMLAAIAFTSVSAHAADFSQEEGAIQNAVRERTQRNVNVEIFPAKKAGCYQVSLFDLNSVKYRVEILVCQVTDENLAQKRDEVASLISRSILETDELIARHVEATADIGSADSAEFSVNEGTGLRIGFANDVNFFDFWYQAPGLIVKTSKDGETKTQWIRTRVSLKGKGGTESEPANNVAKLDVTVWQASMKGDTDGLTAVAGLFRIGTIKLAGGKLIDAAQVDPRYLANVEIELAGFSVSPTFAVTKNLGIFTQAAIGWGLRFLDGNKLKASYASPSDLRLGLVYKDKWYVGGKAEFEMGGETLRETYGGEMMYRLGGNHTLGAALEKTSHNGLDPLVAEPNGWNLNLGLFGDF